MSETPETSRDTAIDFKSLQTASLFKALSEKDTHLATQGIEEIELSAGDVLFHQGDAGDSMFFVVSGQLEVRLRVPGAEDRVVSVVGPNSIIGEMSLLLDEPRAATVIALGQTQLWQVGREKFQEALSWNERWANQFLFYMAQVLARRLGTMNRELVDMMAKRQAAAPNDAAPAELEQMFQNMFANL
jgi:CRP/FNR family transcriptional regulator